MLAHLFWDTPTFLCHRRHCLVGANMPPSRHMLPKTPEPEDWVPPPLTLGILATARPVPQLSALCWAGRCGGGWEGDGTHPIARLVLDAVRLAPVLGHVVVHQGHDVGPDLAQ